tara:strand:+ start:171 stop:476 length:306 start_codon:yes stop_codon:yes gene_type:complete
MKDKITLWDLQQEVKEGIDEQKEKDIGEYYISSDDIQEICDSAIPIYNSDLLDVCKSDLGIGYPDENIGHDNVYSMITWSIYESLSNHAYEYCNDNDITIK